MDRTNINILKALSQNARASFSQIAELVHLSPPAVAERVRRMEEEGIIKSYKAQIDLEKVGIPIRAIVECQVYSTQERAFRDRLLEFDEVIKIYNVTGVTTFIVEVAAVSMSHLDDIIENMIDYCDTNTKMIMRMPVDEVLPKNIENLLKLPQNRKTSDV